MTTVNDEVNVSLTFTAETKKAQSNLTALNDQIKRLEDQVKRAEAELADLGETDASVARQEIAAVNKLITELTAKAKKAEGELSRIGETDTRAARRDIESLNNSLAETSQQAIQTSNDFQTLGKIASKAATEAATVNAKATKERADQLTLLREKADKAEQGFRTMQDVSVGAAAAGALLFAPAILAAEKYVAAVGKSEAVSKKYIAAQERQQKAQIEFGRKAAAALLPYRELLTDIIEKLSRVDPRILQAGIAIGGGIALVGAAGLIASQIGLFAAAVVKLGTYINTLAAVQAAGGAGNIVRTGGILAASGALGVAGGIGATRAIGRATGDERLQEYGLDDTLETFKQLLIIAGTLFLDALSGAAKTIVLIDATLKAIQIRMGLETEKLAEKFEETGRDLKNAIIELVGETVAGKLGIRNEEVTGFRVQNGGTPALTPEQQAAANAAQLVADTNATLQSIDDTILGLKQGLLRAAGIGEDESGGNNAPAFDDQSLDLFDQFQQNEKAALKAHQDEKTAINRRYNDENLKLETEYNRQRQQQLEDFNKAQQQAEADFERNRQRQVQENARQLDTLRKQARDADTQALAEYNESRAETVAEYNREELKRQQDFDRRRQRQIEETNGRLLDAAGKLDAQAIFQILRDSTKQTRQEGEDFGNETTSRQADQRQRLDDLKREYDQQKAQRQQQLRESIAAQQQQFTESQRLAREDFDYRQQMERQRFDESRIREAEAFARQQSERRNAQQRELNDLQNNYNIQKNLRQKQFVDALNQLNGWGQYEATARAAHYRNLNTQLEAFIQNQNLIAGGRGSGARNTGGNVRQRSIEQYADGTPYVPRTGLAMLHQGERVLTANENRNFMRMGLQSLTQPGSRSNVNHNNQRSVTIQNLNVTPPPGMQMSEAEFARFFDKRLITVLEGN